MSSFTLREVSHHIVRAFGKDPTQRQKVERYLNESETSHIDIMTCMDTPSSGEASLSTLGLSAHDIGIHTKRGLPVRIELTACCHKEQVELFKGFLITSSFGIIDTHYQISPNMIYSNIVPLYTKESVMQHILFVTPFSWDLDGMDFNDCVVEFLVPMPISEAEKVFIQAQGIDVFLDSMEDAEVDVGDIYRDSLF